MKTQKHEQGRLSTKYLEVTSSKTTLEGFQFRRLEIKEIYVVFSLSITLFSNHLK